jgi:tetratricopeptide (TPR) repeat protein
LVTLANGRPGTLLVALESLAKGGGIAPYGQGWAVDAARAEDLIQSGGLFGGRGGRLEGLSDFHVHVASCAAVFGARSWLSGVVAMLRAADNRHGGARSVAELSRDQFPEQVQAALRVLSERGLLLAERQSLLAGEVAWRFLDEAERQSLLELHTPEALQALSQQAAVWLQMVAGDRSGELAEVLAPLWLTAGDSTHAAHVYLRAGTQALDEYRHDAARHCLEKARTLAPAELAHVHGEAVLGLGRLAELDGKWAEAEQCYRDALELAWRFRARSRGAKALLHLGRMLRNQGKVVQAVDHLAPALRLYEAAQDLRGLASACDDIGRAYWTAGRLDAAQQFLKRAAQYRERLGDDAGLAHTLTNLGIVLLTRGQLDQARQHLDRSVAMQRSRRHLQGLVEALNAQGAAAVAAGEPEVAVSAMEEGLTLAKRIGNRRTLAQMQNNLGEVQCLAGRVDEGEALLYKAVEGAGRLGDHALLADAARNLAVAARSRNDGERALKWARRSVTAAQSSDVVRTRAFATRTLAEVLADSGDHAAAAETYVRAAEWFLQAGEVRELGACLQGHAAFLVRIGRSSEAAPLLERAEAMAKAAAAAV